MLLVAGQRRGPRQRQPPARGSGDRLDGLFDEALERGRVQVCQAGDFDVAHAVAVAQVRHDPGAGSLFAGIQMHEPRDVAAAEVDVKALLELADEDVVVTLF